MMDNVVHRAISNSLEEVLEMSRCQQARFALAESKHAALCDEVVALRECLAEVGVVRVEASLARAHRLRFARMRSQYPCVLSESLEATTVTRERVLALAAFLGRQAVATLTGASRSMYRSVAAVAQELATTLPTRVYVLGGEDDDGHVLANVERLDPGTDVWEPAMPLRTARKRCACAAVGGHMYVIGGWGVEGTALDTVDRLDPWTSVWQAMPVMAWRRGAASAASVGSAVVALGGQDGHCVHHSAEVLTVPTGGQWTALAPMGRARHYAGAADVGGDVCVVGGLTAEGRVLGNCERYDGAAGVWLEMPELRTPRAGHAVASVGARVFAVGGCDAAGRELSSMESFDVLAAAWEELKPLVVPRWGLGAVACSGRLYAIGGSGCAEDACVGACERFGDAAARGSWSFVGCLRLPRRFFGAVSSR